MSVLRRFQVDDKMHVLVPIKTHNTKIVTRILVL